MILVFCEFYEPVYDAPAEFHDRAIVESVKNEVTSQDNEAHFNLMGRQEK